MHLCTGRSPRSLTHSCRAVLCVYSALFMRFSLAIRPKNYLLFACHATNEVVQLNQLRRWYTGAGGSVAHAEVSGVVLRSASCSSVCRSSSSMPAWPGRTGRLHTDNANLTVDSG